MATHRRTLLFISCLLCFPHFVLSQATQDPQAVSVLSSCVTASGGLQTLSTIVDFTASGTITYNWAGQNVQGTVIAKALGSSNFRIDAQLPAGTRSWVASNGSGTLLDTDGTKTSIPAYNAVNVGAFIWRLPNILASLSNPVVTISYLGLVQSDAGQTHQIHVQFTDTSNPDPVLASVNAIDYFIDPKTFYLLETIDTTYGAGNLDQTLQHEVLYSSQQTIDGVLIPFAVTEQMNKQTVSSIQLSTITFNAGLTLADFQL